MDESSDLTWHPLGELLVKRGFVKPGDVQTALGIQERTGQLLGEILLSLGLIAPSDVAHALGDQYDVHIRRLRWEREHSLGTPPEPRRHDDESFRPLGQVLLNQGLITEDGLMRALREQKHSGMLLGEILVRRRWLTAADIERALAEQRGLATDEKERTAPIYEVREAGVAEPIAECADFLEATDVTFEILSGRDPEELVIFKVEGGAEECVWTYSRAAAREITVAGNQLSPSVAPQPAVGPLPRAGLRSRTTT